MVPSTQSASEEVLLPIVNEPNLEASYPKVDEGQGFHFDHLPLFIKEVVLK